MKLAQICSALALAGCVGNGVEFGGVDKPLAVPANAIACDSASIGLVSRVMPRYPSDAIMFYNAQQRDKALDTIAFVYDIRETGEVANIRFAGSSEYTRHTMRQKMIRATADALAQWRYEWPGAPAYATGCKFTFDYELTNERLPD